MQYRQALELDPHHYLTHLDLSFVYLQMKKIDDAIREIETVVQLTGRVPFALGLQGGVYAAAGRVGDARALLRELQDLSQKVFVPPIAVGWIHHGLGEIDKAVDCFEDAVDSSDPFILHCPVHPGYDSLRSHPRYPALLRRMNLAP